MATQTLQSTLKVYHQGKWIKVSIPLTKADNVAAVSSAAVLTTLIAGFNSAIANLKTAGLMATS